MTTPEKEERKPNNRAKGDGSVYQRSADGRWCGTVALGFSFSGKRLRKTVTAKTKKEAEAKIKTLLQQKRAGEITTKRITFQAWSNTWFTTVAAKKNRPKTLATYRTYLELYIVPVIGNVQLSRLTSDHVREVHTYIESKGLSATTVVQAHAIISVCLKYAQKAGHITKNVALAENMDRPRKAVSSLVILTASHGEQILETVAGDRLYSRWAASLYTGARQGELLGLELDRVGTKLDLSWQLQRLAWEHGCKGNCGRTRGTDCPERKVTTPPDWENRYLTGGLWLTRPKTKKSKRPVPLVEPLRSIIEQRLFEIEELREPNPHGLLWTSDRKLSKGGGQVHTLLPLDGSPIDPPKDNKAWHEILRRAGVPDARLHDARHTTASLLLKAGVRDTVAMQIMGHSTVLTTHGYQDVDEEQMSSALSGVGVLMKAPVRRPSVGLPAERR